MTDETPPWEWTREQRMAHAALTAVHDLMEEWGTDVPWPERGSEDDALLWSAIWRAFVGEDIEVPPETLRKRYRIGWQERADILGDLTELHEDVADFPQRIRSIMGRLTALEETDPAPSPEAGGEDPDEGDVPAPPEDDHPTDPSEGGGEEGAEPPQGGESDEGETPPATPEPVPAEPKPPTTPTDPTTHTGVVLRAMKRVVLGYDATVRVAGFSRAPGLTAEWRALWTGWMPMAARAEHGCTVFEGTPTTSGLQPGDVIEVRAGDATVSLIVGKLGDPGPHGWDVVKNADISGNDLVRPGGRGVIFESPEIVGTVNLKAGVKAWLRNPTAKGVTTLFSRKVREAYESYEAYVEGGTVEDCGNCFTWLDAVIGTRAKDIYGDLYSGSALVLGNHCDHLESKERVQGQPEPIHADGYQAYRLQLKSLLVAGNTILRGVAQPFHITFSHIERGAFVNNEWGDRDRSGSGFNWHGTSNGMSFVGNDFGPKGTIEVGPHTDVLASDNRGAFPALVASARQRGVIR